MRSVILWALMALPAGAAIDPDLGRQVGLEMSVDDVERVTLPCLDADEDQRAVTWFIVDKAGSRRGEGRQVVRYRC